MPVQINIYNKINSNLYLSFLCEINLELDIYYYPEYLEIDADIQKGDYEIFVVQNDTDVFIYPYIKLGFTNPELKNYFDISSPYGYCGPYCTNADFFVEAEILFNEFISQNCVTEFVRYHFLYNENLKFSQGITNFQNRTIVTLDIDQSWEDIWTKEYSGTNRNIIRKLEKEGYNYVITREKDDLNEFVEMYYLTMNNVGADSFYFFDKKLINDLFVALGEKIVLTKVEKDGINYCYSLFFISGTIATYYLSARNLEHSKVPATNFLLSKTVEWLLNKNISTINLGGGLTNDLNDPLFRFKSNFSKSKNDFYIGKRIFNHEIYEDIVNSWISVHGPADYEKRKQILQFYR
jgi:lipid II:glycine glycyltransferase (peptidoglycan interpeptide bridge formation enzyme)